MEEKFYEPIGEWFVRKKECQKDEFSLGYNIRKKVGDAGRQFDVVAMHYEPVKDNEIPSFTFIGHIVEVKDNERKAEQDIGKLSNALKSSNDFLETGFNTLFFYVAYPAEFASKSMEETCRANKIGILLLDQTSVNVEEEFLAPDTQLDWKLGCGGFSHKDQKQRANWDRESFFPRGIGVIIKHPEEFYEKNIGPGAETYNGKISLRKLLDSPSRKETKEALNYLFDRIKQRFNQLRVRTNSIKIIFECAAQQLIVLNPGTRNFNVILGKSTYRVATKDKIEEFFDGKFVKRYDGGLSDLIESRIIPHVERFLKKE